MAHRTYRTNTRARSPRTPTLQTKPIPGREAAMKQNSAGGFSFIVSPWQQLDRFLVLGTTGGTYYTSERELTETAAKDVIRLIKTDGVAVVDRVREISVGGRAPKNDPALFVLALVMTYGSDEAKAAAYEALPSIARIGTHVLHLAAYVNDMRGWGRGIRRAFGAWYTSQTPNGLAMNLVKYANRDGWTHRDILRLAHPRATGVYQQLLAFAAGKTHSFTSTEVYEFMSAVESVKMATDADLAALLIREYKLPREVIPTQLLTEPVVWEALLPHMGLTAMLRNLATMTRLGVLTQGSAQTKLVLKKMRDVEEITRAKLHPIAVLSALMTYRSGNSVRGTTSWTPIMSLVDELDELFYRAFGMVVPTGKRLVIALDVSGSMSVGEIAGVPGLTPRQASAALAMLAARTEKDVHFICFSSARGYCNTINKYVDSTKTNGVSRLMISSKDRLETVIEGISNLDFGGTDCALPMKWALSEKIEADAFIVITDNETWAGSIHPSQALKKYRTTMNIPAKLVVIGMTATDISIADPADAGTMDVVGFDTAAPNIISDFIRE